MYFTKIKTLFAALIIGLCFATAAQAQFEIVQFDSDSNELSSDVISTTDGNYIGLTLDLLTAEDGRLHIIKFATDGTIIWDRYILHPQIDKEENYFLPNIVQLNDGNFAILYSNSNPSNNTVAPFSLLVKVDNNGNEIWRATYEDLYFDLIAGTANEIWLAGNYQPQTLVQYMRLKKIDEDGIEISNWDYSLFINGIETFDYGLNLSINTADEIILSGVAETSPSPIVHFRIAADGTLLSEIAFELTDLNKYDQEVISTPDGGSMYLTAHPYLGSQAYYSLNKIDASGNLVWSKQVKNGDYIRDYNDLIAWNGGAIAVGHNIQNIDTNTFVFNALITFIDGDGNIINEMIVDFNGESETLTSVIPSHDGGLLFFGETYDTPTFPAIRDPFFFATDSLGNLFNSAITGQVFHDLNDNCSIDPAEPNFDEYILSLEGATTYTYSYSQGTYSFAVPSGTYTINANPLNDYWENCSNSETVTLNENEIAEVNFLTKSLIDCSLMSIQHGSSQMRICQEIIYNIEYCNVGTVAEENAYIELVIDPALEILSSTLPFTELNAIYTFEIPDTVDINECGNFEVLLFLNCDTEIGTAICTEVHIFPDSLCTETDLWSGASVALTAECNDPSISFKLENVGNAPSSSLNYIIIEDQVVLQVGSTELAPGEIGIFPFPANGSTLTMMVEQEPFHPGQSMPMASVENCDGMGNTGYVTMFPPDDADYAIDISCKEARNSYDPNIKVAYPKGIGEEHIIAENTDIEYTIYFQNTGNDVAYNVRLADTLSATLNPLSLRPGASSHAYDWSLSGEGILQFFFNDINLPDSTSNPAGSQGWVQYRIAQQENLPIGTRIENRAGIYFDLNPPIITNTVFHNIGDDYAITDVKTITNLPEHQVTISPNPFQAKTQVHIQDKKFQEGLLKVTDIKGNIIYTSKIMGTEHQLDFTNFSSGLYFLQLFDQKSLLWTGKAIIQK